MDYSVLLEGIRDEYNETSDIIQKIGIYIESMYREYLINKEESELKVLTESGTDDDLSFLYEKVEESLDKRITSTMNKIVTAVKSFIEKIIKKVKDKYYDIKVDMFIREFQKELKKRTELASKKVSIFDVSSLEKTFNETIDKCHKLASKIKNNIEDGAEDIANAVRDKLDEIHKSFIDNKKKSEKNRKEIPLKRAISYFQSLKNSITKDKFNKSIFLDIPEKASSLKKKLLLQINQKISQFYKETWSTKFAAVTDSFNRIKTAISEKATELKEKLPTGNTVKESVDENVSIYEECFNELFESVYDEVYTENADESNSFMDELYSLL